MPGSDGDTEMVDIKMPGAIYEKTEVTYRVDSMDSTNHAAVITTTVSSSAGKRL